MSISKRKKEARAFRTIDILIITITHHIHDIYTSFIAALGPEIIRTFGLNNVLFGFLAVVQRIPNLFNPFIGILAERVRVRYFIILAPALSAISMSIMGNMPNYFFLVLIIFVSGFSSASFHVLTPVMTRRLSGDNPGLGMSFYMVGGEFARTLGPLIAVGAVDVWGFNGMFRLIPAGLVSSAILFMRFRNFDLRNELGSNEKTESKHLNVLKTYFKLLLFIALITFFKGGIKALFTHYLRNYFEYLGWESGETKWALTIVYLSGVLGTFFAGTISDFIGRKTVLFIVNLIAPLLVIGFYFTETRHSYLLLVLIGFFILAPTPVFMSIVNTLKSKHLTFLNGIYMTIIFLMSALALLLTGWCIDVFEQNPDVVLLITAFCALITVPLVLFLPDKKN